MKQYQVLIYEESLISAFLSGGGRIDPIAFANFLNIHAQSGWRVITIERESRRTLLFFEKEAMVIIMERDV